MKKNNLKDLITKENKYENYILLVLSIISIVLGLLVLFNVLILSGDLGKNKTIFSNILIVFGIICGVFSIFKINKISKFNKTPKPIIYNLIKNAYETKDESISKLFSDNGYTLILDDEDYPIFSFGNEYNMFLSKDILDIFIRLDYKQLIIELALNDECDKQVTDEYYEYEEDLFTKTIELDENSDFNTLINNVNLLYEEKINIILERFEQYKIK